MDLAAGSLGGVVAWYSLIHTPLDRLAPVLASLAGSGRHHIQQAYCHEVSMHGYLLDPDIVAAQLKTVGLLVEAQLLRAPDADERTPQGYLMARKPQPPAGPA